MFATEPNSWWDRLDAAGYITKKEEKILRPVLTMFIILQCKSHRPRQNKVITTLTKGYLFYSKMAG